MLIRQAELMREPEKNGIKFLKGLNKIGLLKSQKPLSVSLLAKKMIIESKSEKSVQLKTYQLKDIL